MLFHIFCSQDERRNFGGSAFIEVQFCKLPADMKLKRIVADGSIKNWQNDSLYIDDVDLFYKEYSGILNCGWYNNLKAGVVDVFGINYYTSDQIDSIIQRLAIEKPIDYELFTNWLMKAKTYNGFYILGI